MNTSITNHSQSRIAAFALVATLSAVAALALSGGIDVVQADTPTVTTIQLSSTFDPRSQTYTDNGKKGESAGDVFTGATTLRKDGIRYGRLQMVSTAVDPRYEGDIQSATIFLPDGTLSIQGGGVNKKIPGAGTTGTTSLLAITGGTGVYAGADGTIEVQEGKKSDMLIIRVQS